MRSRSLKTVAVLVLALLLAYGAASWYAGRLAQDHINAWVAQFGETVQSRWPPEFANAGIRVVDYRPGIFSSSIQYQVELPAVHDQPAGSFFVQDELQHGPWPLAAVRMGVWRPLAAYSVIKPLPGGAIDPWFEAARGVPPWLARTQIGFDGQVSAVLDLAPAKTDDGLLDFSGARLNAGYDPNACQGHISGQADNLLLHSLQNGARTRIHGLQLDANGSCDGSSAHQLEQRLSFDEVQIQSPDSMAYVLRNLDMKLSSARTGGLDDSKLDYELSSLLVNDQDMGRIQAGLQSEHLDHQAAQALFAWYLNQDDIDAGDAGMLEETRQQLHRLLVPFLASSPRFSLNYLRWENSDGGSEISAQIAFQAAAGEQYVEPGVLLEESMRHLKAHVRLSKPMLLQAVRQFQASGDAEYAVNLVSMLFDMYTGQLQRQGLLRMENGDVLTDVEYAHGLLTVNGNTAPLVDFLELFGKVPGLR